MKIERRFEELKAQGYEHNRIIEILDDELPDYHKDYIDELLTDFEKLGGKLEKLEKVTKYDEVEKNDKNIQKVKVVGFDMPFSDMVIFIVKWSIAAIPAVIILFIIGFIITALLASLGFVF